MAMTLALAIAAMDDDRFTLFDLHFNEAP